MTRRLAVFAVLFCLVTRCYAADIKVNVDGYWGRNPVSYTNAVKRLHFPLLLPQGWRGENCVVYLRWVLQDKVMASASITPTGNDSGPGLPSRQAAAIALKGDSRYLILEAPYIRGYSPYANRQGMYWIVASGYFTKALNDPRLGGMSIGRRGKTSYVILTAYRSETNLARFEKSLH